VSFFETQFVCIAQKCIIKLFGGQTSSVPHYPYLNVQEGGIEENGQVGENKKIRGEVKEREEGKSKEGKKRGKAWEEK